MDINELKQKIKSCFQEADIKDQINDIYDTTFLELDFKETNRKIIILKNKMIDELSKSQYLSAEDLSNFDLIFKQLSNEIINQVKVIRHIQDCYDSFDIESRRKTNMSAIMALGAVVLFLLTIIGGVIIMIIAGKESKKQYKNKQDNLAYIAKNLKLNIFQFKQNANDLKTEFGLDDQITVQQINEYIQNINKILNDYNLKQNEIDLV